MAGDAFPVLADGGFLVSSIYGVAFQMRIHTDTSNTPGMFLVDRACNIRVAHIGAGPRNFADRPAVEDTFREIDIISKKG